MTSRVPSKSSQRQIFVVRFVAEQSGTREQWQGQLEHVQTGQRRPFKSDQQLLEAMEDLLSKAGGDR